MARFRRNPDYTGPQATDPLFMLNHRIQQHVARVGATAADSFGGGSLATSGTLANADDAAGAWIKTTSAASTSSYAHFAGTANVRRNWWPDTVIAIRTPTTITNLRIWVSMSNSTALSDTQAANTGGYFRYSTSASDTGWAIITADTAAQTVATNVATFAADTAYRLRIRMDDVSVHFYVDGVWVGTSTANLPVAATNMTFQALVETRENVAKDIRWGRATVIQRA